MLIFIIISNDIPNLPLDIVFNHCSSIVFLPFSPPFIQSVSQFKLIRKQNNLQF